jgi:hypothetical protein
MITHQMKFCLLVFLAVTILVLAGCGGIPKDALKLTSESLQKRVLQTRKYEGVSEVDLLLASAGAIQDLGFNIDESEIELGLIVGSKERDATEIGQELLNIGCLLAGAFSGQPSSGIATDDHQEFRVSLVVRQFAEESDRIHLVRVTFQRVVWDTNNEISKQEALEDPETYQEFFSRLSKSVFLEGEKI